MKFIRTALLSMLLVQPAFAESLHITQADGLTLNKQGQVVNFTDMWVRDGKVLAIGGSNQAPAGFEPDSVVDLQGQVVMPGLIDAHGHLLGLGATLLEVDIRGITSRQRTIAIVSDYAQRNPDLEWVIGRGWNQVLWPEKVFPTAAQLDERINQRPVWLTRIDGHAGWANNKALQIAGITADTLDPPGGKIIRDNQGKPTGVLIDTAMDLLEKHLPKPDEQTYTRQLDAAGEHLLSLGITSMHDAGISKAVAEFYQARANSGSLPLRVYAMLAATDPELMSMLQQGPVQDQAEFLSIRSVKAYGDGALGSRGAALLTPYQDDPENSGLLVTRQSQLPALFQQVLSADFQLNFHAIGDRANRLALDHFELAFDEVGGRDLRHRVEHAQVVALDDIPRFARLGIIPSMQPTHATSDKNMAADRVGEQRLLGAYAWQRFLNQGSPLAFGSDFPVELADPFYGLHAAVTRQDRDNQPRRGWLPDQSMTVTQALRAFTLDAAYAAHQEQSLGSLEAGKWADFIVVDQDIFSIAPDQIWKTKVLQTWIAGKQVYNR